MQMKHKDIYIVISFMTTKFTLLKQHWARYTQSKFETSLGTDRGLPLRLGGKVVILNWTTRKIVWDIDIDVPSGIFLDTELLFVNSFKNEVLGISPKGKIEYCLRHPKFNALHSLLKVGDNFLVTSSGLDLILEIDSFGKEIFEWWAIDYGFDQTPTGDIRKIDKSINHSKKIYPTIKQTTHINSVIPYEDTTFLATLFHQGMLVKINKINKNFTILSDKLSNPHNVYKISNSILLSDTSHNQALIYDERFNVIKVIKNKFQWVQDTILLTNGNFLIADADNNRIVEMCEDGDNFKVIDHYDFNKEWRIFQILEILPNHLQFISIL